jgi:hypothetical protein
MHPDPTDRATTSAGGDVERKNGAEASSLPPHAEAERESGGPGGSPEVPQTSAETTNPLPHAANGRARPDGAVDRNSATTAPDGERGTESAAPADRDQALHRLAVGTWEDEYQGKRTMTLRQDGSAVMVVELEGLKATLFASRLVFEMTWAVQRGRLIKETLRGEPANKVALILKMMGNRVEEKILQLTEGRLMLLDKDGRTVYDWRRVR